MDKDFDESLVINTTKGKYEGKIISDIPSKYLLWLARNCYNDSISTAADLVWQYRERFNLHWESD